jgi:hypothetical protein
MGFASVEHAERHIRDVVAQGLSGDEDYSFVNVVTRGMPPSDNLSAMVLKATKNLEEQGAVKVTWSEGGLPQIVELCCDDQVVALPPPVLSVVKRSLGKFELLKEMHDLLKEMADDNGVIQCRQYHDEFVTALHRKLSERFTVDILEVATVFDVMTTLDLRGNSKSMRGAGMSVCQDSLVDLVSADDPVVAGLQRQLEEAKTNLAQMTDQLFSVRTENYQLSADLSDVRGRHERATEQIMNMRRDLDRVTTSRNQLRQNNDQLALTNQSLIEEIQRLKVLPAEIAKVVSDMANQ